MKVVGLTGGIGSGKTTVLKMFQELGITCYIADLEARKLIDTSKNIRKKIVKEFGEKSYTAEGLHRKYIAKIVFEDPEKLQILNAIVHPKVHKHLKKFIAKSSGDYIIYENAILFENGSDKLCDCIITVTAPLETKIARVLKRDNTTRTDILNRIKNQFSDEDKISKSDFVIENIDLEETSNKVLQIQAEILKNCCESTRKT